MSSPLMSQIAQNLEEIHQRIFMSCQSCGRKSGDVQLIAVSKNMPLEYIQAAYDLGHRDFGESRAQELQTKVHQLPNDIKWHFIGKLQSNKAKHVAQLVHTIHTIESINQLREFDKQDRTFDGFIQVNIAKETQKSGIFIEDVDKVLSYVLKCSHVRFKGLMTIGPDALEPEESRLIFRQLAELNREVGGEFLSMGMSNDYDVAIQEGATHIRVGSAIFGSR